MVPDRIAFATLAVLALVAVSGCLSAGPLTESQEEKVIEEFEEEMADVDGYSTTVEATTEYDGETTEMVMAVETRSDTGEMRQEVLEPANLTSDVVVTNETHTVSYDADENTAFVTEVSSDIERGIGAEVTRLVETHEVYYNGTDTVDGDKVHKATLVPENETAVETRTTVWIDQETLFPVKMATDMTHEDGEWNSSTTMTYTDVELNPGLDDDTFEFDVPANATVTTPEDINESYETVDSYDELVEQVDRAVPEPAVPEAFEFDSGTIMSDGEQVTLSYTDGEADLLVTQSQDGGTWEQDGETVDLGGTTATLTDDGPFTSVAWTCDGDSYRVVGSASQEALVDTARSLGCS